MKTLEVLDKVLKGKRIAYKTRQNYTYALNSLAKYSEEWPSDPVVINEWLNQLEGYSDMTVYTFFRYVRSAGRYMEKISGKNQYGAYNMPNPTTDAERPQVEHRELSYRTGEEMMRCLKVCRKRAEFCLIAVLIDSAVRIGELGRHVRDPEKYSGLYGRDVGENFIRVRGKTGERRHRLSVDLCRALRDLAGGDDKAVFKRRDGLAKADSHLATDVTNIVKRAGITGKKLGAHSFRHGTASLVARVTGSQLAVKSVLVHDNITTSMKYIHDAEHDLADSISPIELLEKRERGVNHEQLLLGVGGVEQEESAEVVDINGEVIEGEDLVSELFADIPDGTEVRPLLKTADLRLIREVAIEFTRVYRGDNRVYAAQELLRRMLRRVK